MAGRSRRGRASLYAAVRLSPLSFKPTLSLSLFVLMLAGMLLYNLSGQALGIGRYLLAIIAWRLAPKHHRAPDTRHPVRGGVLVDAVPLTLTTRGPPPARRGARVAS